MIKIHQEWFEKMAMEGDKPLWSRQDFFKQLWEIAAKPPEETRGSLKYQVEACKRLVDHAYEPVLKRLTELAQIDPARTKGNRRGQDASEKQIKRFLSLIKVDKTER